MFNDKNDYKLNEDSYSECDDCGKKSEDVDFVDLYGDGDFMNLCNQCAEYRSDSL